MASIFNALKNSKYPIKEFGQGLVVAGLTYFLFIEDAHPTLFKVHAPKVIREKEDAEHELQVVTLPFYRYSWPRVNQNEHVRDLVTERVLTVKGPLTTENLRDALHEPTSEDYNMVAKGLLALKCGLVFSGMASPYFFALWGAAASVTVLQSMRILPAHNRIHNSAIVVFKEDDLPHSFSTRDYNVVLTELKNKYYE